MECPKCNGDGFRIVEDVENYFMKECENCGGQGIDPNDDGTGTFLCEICGGRELE